MRLTFKHLREARTLRTPVNVNDASYFLQDKGIVTLQYPFETIPVPDNGRYRLHNEIDDCIVCDKCAVVCPVNCIDIVPVRSPEPIGLTSDGTTKRIYAATFDIDMAKCCYCGLCTTVCPTECLTMTKEYDYSEFDIRNMNYQFSDLTPEEVAEKQIKYDQFLKEKEAAKNSTATEPVRTETGEEKKIVGFKPKFGLPKPVSETPPPIDLKEEPQTPIQANPKPVMKPVIKKPGV